MYGENLDLSLVKLKQENREILVVVGAEKVPGDIYNLADLNISIGNQPHSEIAALAVFLDRIYRGKELYSTHLGAKVRIHPDRRRKVVLNLA
jgi:tRNA (cytidine56-2'-O)-methyltransferase